MTPDDSSKITAQMRKGILESLILSIIKKGEAYASDILEQLKKNNLIVVEGTLYPLLSRLKNEKLIGYYWVESQSGPPRKYYRLTEKGQEMQKIMAHVWGELSTAVGNITKE
jgi:PadR family transcriptional regulator PadR